MRKTIFLLLLLILPVFVFSEVVFSQEIPDEIASVINNAIEENNRGREDIVFSVSDYEETIVDSDVELSFSLEFLDKTLHIDVHTSQKGVEKAISTRIKEALYYEELLYSEAEEKLDYIYSGSFSFFPAKDYRRGTTFVAKDENGRSQGLFEINHQYSDVDELQALYQSKAVMPGMRLERASSFRYALSGATNFYKGSFGLSAELGNTSLLYPFVPILSVVFEQRNNSYSIYGGIGLSGYIDLNDFLKTSFTLIQEGRIGASASLLLGVSSGKFAYNGTFSIYYEHRILPRLMWRIGYAKYPMLGHSLVLGIGGSF